MPTKGLNKHKRRVAIDTHCHSTFSIRDGIGKPEEVVARGLELGWPAVTLSEHGFFLPVYSKGEIYTYTRVSRHILKWASQWNWQIHWTGKNYYVARQQWNQKPSRIYLHREILGLEYGDKRFGDHINGNTLDNRIKNLRILTKSQSNQNVNGHKNSTSKFRGVSWDMKAGKWEACVKLNYKKIFLGYFEDENEAAQVAEDFRAETMEYSVRR